jgi:hypothetical protein
MAMKKTVAVVAVCLLGAAAFVASRHVVRRPPAPAMQPPVADRPALVPFVASTAAPVTSVMPAETAAPVALGPWPLDFPPASWPEPVRRTWKQLRERVALAFMNEPLTKVLDWLSSELRVAFVIDPALLRDLKDRTTSMRVSEIIGDGCLKLLLAPLGAAFEILEDGSIRIAKSDDVAQRYEKEGLAILARQRSLERVTQALAGGWDGVAEELDGKTRECRERLRETASVSAHREPLEEVLTRLRETTRLNIVIDAVIGQIDPVSAAKAGTAWEVLEEVARAAGVGVCVGDGVVIFTTAEHALRARQSELESRVAQAEDVKRLVKPVAAGATSIAEFAKAMERATGLPVVTSREVWESGGTVSIAAGGDARAALESSGFKWAVYGGRLWLVR